MKPIRILNIYNPSFGTRYAGNVYDANGISPVLMTMQGGSMTPMILTQGYGGGKDKDKRHD